MRSEDKLGDLQQQLSFIEEDMRRLKEFHSRELELLTRERNRLLSVSEIDDADDDDMCRRRRDYCFMLSLQF